MAKPSGAVLDASRGATGPALARIKYRILAGFIGASLALLFLVLLSAYAAIRAVTLSEEVRRAETLVMTLHEIIINVMRAESAALRLQINHTAAEEAGLARAIENVSTGVQLVDAMAAMQPLLREPAARLRRLVYLDQVDRSGIDLRRGPTPAGKGHAEDAAAALASVQLDTEAIRAVATEMLQHQRFAIQHLHDEERDSDHLSQASLVGIVAAMIVTFIALCWRVDQGLRLQSRLRRVESAAQQELEARVLARTSELRDANFLLHAENLERKRIEAILTEQQTRIRMLLAHQGARIEEERRHIAREVHDGLAQDIYALRIDLCRLNACAGAQHTRLNRRLEEGLVQIDRLIGNVRAIIDNLRPEVLDLGLLAALRWHLQQFQQRTGLPASFSANVSHIALDELLGIALFRIFQETTANIARHAAATCVAVKVVLLESDLMLQVSDDGRGFDIDAARKAGSLGLLGIAERASAINAAIDIFSTKGNGTTIRVRVSLSRTA